MAVIDTGKYQLTINDASINSEKARLKALEHVQESILDKSMTVTQRVGYMFWLRQHIDAFFENIYEKEQEKVGASND